MKKYISILFIFFYIIPIIKSVNECTGCNSNTAIKCSSSSNSDTSCNINCRPKYSSGSVECKFCNFQGEQFYRITTQTTEGSTEEVCTPLSSCGDKIVYKSKECVTSCYSDFFIMGDYCYMEQPENTYCDETSKECNCLYNYYKTETNKFVFR